MFGQEIMLFQTTASIDDKNRVVIPSKTKVEKNDKLVLIKEDKYISIYNINIIKKKIQMLAKAKQKALFARDIEFIKFIDEEFDSMSVDAKDTVSVDTNHRIIIPQTLREIYDFDKEVYVEGAINHINLFKNELEFEKYKNTVKRKRS